jgi:hypothetical protein
MTAKEFIKNLKNYYGEYSEIVELTLAEYIIQTYYEEEFEPLFKLITDQYTNVFKMPPDKAKIIEIVDEHNEKLTWWSNKLENKLGKYYKDQAKKKLIEDEKYKKERLLIETKIKENEIKKEEERIKYYGE